MNATHHGYADDQKKIIARLNRIEGQVRREQCVEIGSAAARRRSSQPLCQRSHRRGRGSFRSENRRGKRGHSTPRKIVDRKTCQSPIQQAKTHHRRQIGDRMIRPEKFQTP